MQPNRNRTAEEFPVCPPPPPSRMLTPRDCFPHAFPPVARPGISVRCARRRKSRNLDWLVFLLGYLSSAVVGLGLGYWIVMKLLPTNNLPRLW